MELLVALALVVAAGAAVVGWRRLAERKVLAAVAGMVEEARAVEPARVALRGAAITRSWSPTDLASEDDARVPRRLIVTAHGVLPAWATFAWRSSGAALEPREARSAGEVLMLALMGAEAAAEVPRAITVTGATGDLSLEAEVDPAAEAEAIDPLTALLAHLGAAFLARGEARALDDLAAIARGTGPAAERALALLARRLPQRPETRAALAHAAASPDLVLRAIAACADLAGGGPALRAIAGDPGAPLAAVEHAVDGLLARGDLVALIDVGAIPPSRRAAVAEALGRQPLPGASALLTSWLDATDRDALDAVVRALARVGAADAVAPLRACGARAPAELKVAIDIAIDLIQERAGGARVRGGVSIVAGDPAAGRLSLVGDAAGQLSLAQAPPGEPERS